MENLITFKNTVEKMSLKDLEKEQKKLTRIVSNMLMLDDPDAAAKLTIVKELIAQKKEEK